MTIFYWVMATLIGATFVPSVFFLILYAATGERACIARAKAFWNICRVLALFAFNLLVWGHVLYALWQIGFR